MGDSDPAPMAWLPGHTRTEGRLLNWVMHSRAHSTMAVPGACRERAVPSSSTELGPRRAGVGSGKRDRTGRRGNIPGLEWMLELIYILQGGSRATNLGLLRDRRWFCKAQGGWEGPAGRGAPPGT